MINLEKVVKSINNNDVLLFVKVSPNSKKNQIIEVIEYSNKYYLKIKIKEIALENKANKALIEYLSKIFSIPKSNASIESGTTLSYKSIKIKDISPNLVQEKILHLFKEK